MHFDDLYSLYFFIFLHCDVGACLLRSESSPVGMCVYVCVEQVLEEEEYEVWLKRHLLAESSIENREELLLDSAERLETNLNLLGERAAHCS